MILTKIQSTNKQVNFFDQSFVKDSSNGDDDGEPFPPTPQEK